MTSNLEPVSLSIYGSFARGEAVAGSDIDILAIRPTNASEHWADRLTEFGRRAESLTGNLVQFIEYYQREFLRLATVEDEAGQGFWTAIYSEAVTVIGTPPVQLLRESHISTG